MKIITPLEKRYERTQTFIEKHVKKDSRILDLGTENTFSRIMKDNGYHIINTNGEDLDIFYQKYIDCNVDVVMAFEIFEHMLAPFNILRELKTSRLVASVPLRLWFANAYWNEKNDWDKHYHEFEPKQFDLLLQRTGWKIIDSEKWTGVDWQNFGIRPILRHFYPRYYIVYCERESNFIV
jgi:hypothetical protein